MIEPIDKDRLRDARLQLHWAAQVLSATCDAVFERRPDDSQSSLRVAGKFSESLETQPLPSGHELILRADKPTLIVWDGPRIKASVGLGGMTIDAMLAWVCEHLPDLGGRTPSLRDYDMPEHRLAHAGAFDDSDADAFRAAMARLGTAWHTLGALVTQYRGTTTELLLWPHHFDLGSILLLRSGDDPATDPCLGIGYSLGDDSIDEPYFYANPYAVEKPDDPPELPAGTWTDQWFGALLTESHIRARAGDPSSRDARSLVHEMTDAALSLTRQRAGL